MIDDLLTGLFGGYLADKIARKRLPAKADSRFDCISQEDLRRKNHWVEMVATAILAASFILIFVGMMVFGLEHNAWRIGLLFCFPVTLMLIFVCAATLPRGLSRFSEFWRYHELKAGVRLDALLMLYIPFAGVGAICLFKSFP
jgi:hypothetical protein